MEYTSENIEQVAAEIEQQALNDDRTITSSTAHRSGVVFPEDLYQMPKRVTIIFDRKIKT